MGKCVVQGQNYDKQRTIIIGKEFVKGQMRYLCVCICFTNMDVIFFATLFPTQRADMYYSINLNYCNKRLHYLGQKKFKNF